MSHANARLTPAGRLIMVQRIQSGRAVAHVAAEMGSLARPRGGGGGGSGRWAARGLSDRSSVARSHPHRTGPCEETRVRIMRELTRRGPVSSPPGWGCRPPTVGRVLPRHQPRCCATWTRSPGR